LNGCPESIVYLAKCQNAKLKKCESFFFFPSLGAFSLGAFFLGGKEKEGGEGNNITIEQLV
jgi:hypothetical protein